MVTEDYVGFETAKLLKKKGFDMSCEYLGYNIFDSNHRQDTIENFSRSEAPHLYVPTISQARAMKWLREIHNLEIFPYHNSPNNRHNSGWWFEIIKYPNSVAEYESGIDEEFDTYEETCEAAIKYCLENLI